MLVTYYSSVFKRVKENITGKGKYNKEKTRGKYFPRYRNYIIFKLK